MKIHYLILLLVTFLVPYITQAEIIPQRPDPSVLVFPPTVFQTSYYGTSESKNPCQDKKVGFFKVSSTLTQAISSLFIAEQSPSPSSGDPNCVPMSKKVTKNYNLDPNLAASTFLVKTLLPGSSVDVAEFAKWSYTSSTQYRDSSCYETASYNAGNRYSSPYKWTSRCGKEVRQKDDGSYALISDFFTPELHIGSLTTSTTKVTEKSESAVIYSKGNKDVYDLTLQVSAHDMTQNPASSDGIISCNKIKVAGIQASTNCTVTIRIQNPAGAIDVTPSTNSKYFEYSVEVKSFIKK